MIKNSISTALVLSLLLLIGCGGNVTVTGKVVFSDDGSPLTVGTVCFASNGSLARGDIQPDGTFTVGTLGERDGLPPGTYSVYILGASRIIGSADAGIDEQLIDLKHTSPDTSGKKVEITSSIRDFVIEVDRFRK